VRNGRRPTHEVDHPPPSSFRLRKSGGILPPILNSHCRKSSYFSRTSLKNNNMEKKVEDLLKTQGTLKAISLICNNTVTTTLSQQLCHSNSHNNSVTTTLSQQQCHNNCHNNTVTTTVSQQQCHSNTVTTTVSQQHCHNNSVTATLSQQQCHNNTVTTTVTTTLSQQLCHNNSVTATLS